MNAKVRSIKQRQQELELCNGSCAGNKNIRGKCNCPKCKGKKHGQWYLAKLDPAARIIKQHELLAALKAEREEIERKVRVAARVEKILSRYRYRYNYQPARRKVG